MKLTNRSKNNIFIVSLFLDLFLYQIWTEFFLLLAFSFHSCAFGILYWAGLVQLFVDVSLNNLKKNQSSEFNHLPFNLRQILDGVASKIELNIVEGKEILNESTGIINRARRR